MKIDSIADNFICMDKERIEGFCAAFKPGVTMIWEIPKTEKERTRFYQDKLQELLESRVTAVLQCQIFMHLSLCGSYRERT